MEKKESLLWKLFGARKLACCAPEFVPIVEEERQTENHDSSSNSLPKDEKPQLKDEEM